MDLLNLLNLMLVATGDDSHPWIIALCLIVSIAIMIFLFLLGGKDKDKK
ncbi:MAG: hypothetical protein IKQ71_05815 [Lachnospiraceae bacterium]|nr:hypothetical protein [Lachnospiraceae bacterium]